MRRELKELELLDLPDEILKEESHEERIESDDTGYATWNSLETRIS